MDLPLLPVREPILDFSFIVPMRNNITDLQVSLDSICAQAPAMSEIVVVDGSDEPLGETTVRTMVRRTDIAVVYTCDDKSGVFGAMNVGVAATRGRWLVMMPAGDLINPGARMHLETLTNSAMDAIVFAQDMATPEGKRLYSFRPTASTIWPHHSVVLKRTVHERYGFYPLQYRYTSDQQFFAYVRHHISFEIRPDVLTTFMLGGISSGASRRISCELFELRRKLGDGITSSLFRAYITPYVRAWIERHTGYGGLATRIRVRLLGQYSGAPEQTRLGHN